MAISNKLGPLVLATGNKSEMSVGYSTLYGDMVGGFAPLRDVSKTWVYRLSRWRNASEGREVIPEETIQRPPDGRTATRTSSTRTAFPRMTCWMRSSRDTSSAGSSRGRSSTRAIRSGSSPT